MTVRPARAVPALPTTGPARSRLHRRRDEPVRAAPGRTPQPGRRATTHAAAIMAAIGATPVSHVTPAQSFGHSSAWQAAWHGRAVHPLPAPVLNRPSPRVLCAWSPGRLRCAACAHATQQRIRGTREDRRCDRCHAIVPKIHPDVAQFPAVVVDLPPWPAACSASAPPASTPTRSDQAGRSGASVLQDLVHRPEVTRVGFHQFVARAAAQYHDLNIRVAAMLPLQCEPFPDRLPAAALGELPDRVRAGPPVVDNQEVPHTWRVAHKSISSAAWCSRSSTLSVSSSTGNVSWPAAAIMLSVSCPASQSSARNSDSAAISPTNVSAFR